MGYFDTRKNVDDYLRMSEGYDGRELIDILKEYLPQHATLLELGMGPGKDLKMLSGHFKVTGSDTSKIFLDLFRENHSDIEVLELDALTIETNLKFDCIYTNKVLHHLSTNELIQSFNRQAEVLHPGGLLFHSFWYGEGEEEHHGLRFVYYTEKSLSKMIPSGLNILRQERYKEFDDDDSFYVILKKVA